MVKNETKKDALGGKNETKKAGHVRWAEMDRYLRESVDSSGASVVLTRHQSRVWRRMKLACIAHVYGTRVFDTHANSIGAYRGVVGRYPCGGVSMDRKNTGRTFVAALFVAALTHACPRVCVAVLTRDIREFKGHVDRFRGRTRPSIPSAVFAHKPSRMYHMDSGKSNNTVWSSNPQYLQATDRQDGKHAASSRPRIDVLMCDSRTKRVPRRFIPSLLQTHFVSIGLMSDSRHMAAWAHD